MGTPYRLGGGRSNHVWRAGRFILKLFENFMCNPLFGNSATDEQRVLEALSGTGLAPELCAAGRFEGLHWLLYHHIEGGPWRGNTAKVAEILGGLHQLNAVCDLPLGANGSADLAAQTQIILNASGISSDEFFYRPKEAVPATDRLCLIHGDPVPGNIVVQQNRMVLIDWQCPKLG
ncbi:MAG: aminoglycoside phosphotransferase family protein, partial [Epibacterium sp.]|nr:aminoglycoside phosphotransferase family protein [Epibacterium sp.]NQX75549.1 aminoglycoside phosphotransferase family protein [Epibacterium sp.]